MKKGNENHNVYIRNDANKPYLLAALKRSSYKFLHFAKKNIHTSTEKKSALKFSKIGKKYIFVRQNR